MSPIPSIGLSICRPVGPMNELWKTADLICMPFGVVSGVCRGMSVLDGVHISPDRKRRFWVFIVPFGLNGVFECILYLTRV